MGLRNGSDEYWEIVEHAERIYRKKPIVAVQKENNGLKEVLIWQTD